MIKGALAKYRELLFIRLKGLRDYKSEYYE